MKTPSKDGHSRVPTLSKSAEGHTRQVASARLAATLRGRRPIACPETSRAGTGRSLGCLRTWSQTASGSLRTYADDGRAREVGPLYGTEEPVEQGRGTGCGDGGGTGAAR